MGKYLLGSSSKTSAFAGLLLCLQVKIGGKEKWYLRIVLCRLREEIGQKYFEGKHPISERIGHHFHGCRCHRHHQHNNACGGGIGVSGRYC